MVKQRKKLVLIDAHALIHRAFHALPPLSTKTGQPINAVYGFLLITLSALKELKPDYVAVAFDSPGKTFRHKQFPAYKATRKETPDDLLSQFPLVHEAVEAFGFANFSLPEYEADDIIGTICKQFDGQGQVETIIVTGDLDLLQLVDDDTKVLKLQRGVKDTVLYDPAMVLAKHGLRPEQIIEYKGLRGDSSDNIPGVKGIGEKGATELLQTYDTIDGIYQHLDDITGRNKKPLEAGRESAELSRQLATIHCDAPMTFDIAAAELGSWDNAKIIELFQKYEFKSLLGTLKTLPGFVPDTTPTQTGLFATIPQTDDGPIERDGFEYHLVQSTTDVQKLVAQLQQQPIFAFDTETTGLDPLQSNLVGISFSWQAGSGYYLACGTSVPTDITAIFANPKIKKTGHNVKFDIKVLHHAGAQVNGITFDSMIASYLLNPSGKHGLDHLAFVEFGHQMMPIKDLIGVGKSEISMAEVGVNKVSWYASEDADFTWRLYQALQPRLHAAGGDELLDRFELPTLQALIRMEELGVKLDVEFLSTMSARLHKRIKQIEGQAYALVGTPFNLASSVQLKKILYDDLGLSTDKIKKTKTGYSTAASELEKLRGAHPIIELLEEHRELSKLTSTYLDALPKLINPATNRVHTSYSQTIAATGRLSSTDPNLQNIPIRTELGREIRKAFVADRGKRIVSIDYSQIELRVVAHLAKDAVMTEAFLHGDDIHVRTAAELNSIDPEKVSKDMRRQAKAINFGILYGMGVQGIMRDSGVSRDDARDFLDRYFTIHSGIKAYIDQTKIFADQHEYTETLFGRRRLCPDIHSGNRVIAAGAERAAVNMPIQGTAADIMKLAMIAVDAAIQAGAIKADMLLQVHDELVFEIDAKLVQTEAKKIQKIMESVVTLDVPLVVDVEFGTNWGDLQPV